MIEKLAEFRRASLICLEHLLHFMLNLCKDIGTWYNSRLVSRILSGVIGRSFLGNLDARRFLVRGNHSISREGLVAFRMYVCRSCKDCKLANSSHPLSYLCCLFRWHRKSLTQSIISGQPWIPICCAWVFWYSGLELSKSFRFHYLFWW